MRLRDIVCSIVLVAIILKADGFNLEVKEKGLAYTVSPVVAELGIGTPPQLPTDVSSSFYGYDLKLLKQNDKNISLVIGSPKMMDPSNIDLQKSASINDKIKQGPKGSIFVCQLDATFFRGKTPQCKVSQPSETEKGDHMGMSVPIKPNGNLMTCSTTRVQDCGKSYFVPGYCFKSDNYGSTWREDVRTKKLKCSTAKIVEVLFVLDGSGSVKKWNFQTVKKWVKNITKKLDIEKGKIRVGVVQYAKYKADLGIQSQPEIKTHIRIGEHTTYKSFADAVTRINFFDGGYTYTGKALEKVFYDFTTTSNYNKNGTKQIMILLTDGKSHDSTDIPKNAKKLRDIGVLPFAVGVANYVKSELRLIANGNKNDDTRVSSADNFDGLDTIAKNLETEIGSLVLEGTGGGQSTAGYKMQFGAVGFAGTYSRPYVSGGGSATNKNGRLYLGAVGAYDWSGTVTKYDSVDADMPDIPKYSDVQKVLPNRTKESYLGYSVVTGFFKGGSNEYVASGAPRYMLMGAVVVYRPENGNAKFNDPVTLMGHPSTRQLGAYFGGSVLAIDVNNDSYDDLLIGSPLYNGDNYDEGRVFVYVSQGANTLPAWANVNYKPLELYGNNLIGGRFGSAMASAGDLNMDGYNDVIVGAPLTEGDKGAVFVYHGNENGLDTKAKQQILASQLTGVTLKYFGQSLQGGVDLDGNQYPDIAVGAPKSDTVVIFRSRPVVNLDATIDYMSPDIDIFECIDKNYQNCSSIRVCFTASGTTVEDTVGITFNLTLDVDKVGADKRLEFRSSSNLAIPGEPTWTEPIQLDRARKTCLTKSVHMKSNIKDYDSPIKSEVKFDLLSSHTDRPLSSVRDPDKPNTKQDTLNFAKKCGGDGECNYDLKIDASLTLPDYTTSGGNDLTESGQVLVVDQKTAAVPVTVKVNLTNNGENAFDTRIKVTYTSQISLSTLGNRIAFPPSNSCMVEDTDPVDIGGGLREQILRYNYKTNIMRQNAWCYFEFNLITENLRNNGTLETFTVNVTAYTSDSSSSSKEQNINDNSWSRSPRIKYRSNFWLNKLGESEIPFNYTTEEANITSVLQIGENSADIEIAMEVRGSGYSNIPKTNTALTYPLKTSHGDMLMYLYKVDCASNDPNSKASCSCNEQKINTYDLTLEAPNENNTNGSFVTITPPQRKIEMSKFDCYSNASNTNFTCETLNCEITDLRASERITFKAYFRLWSSSIDFNGTGFDELEMQSRFTVDTSNSPYIIDENGNNNMVDSKQVISKAKKYETPIPPEPASDVIWIYIVAAVGGLLLLILLVLILWKAGFFKSKYADMKKDAQDDLDDETDFQGNGNGSTADMVD